MPQPKKTRTPSTPKTPRAPIKPPTKPSIFFTDSEAKPCDSLSSQFAEHMEFDLVKTRDTAVPYDFYQALSMGVRDRLVRRWMRTQETYRLADVRHVHYLSLEFLMGRLLGNALHNMEFYDECRDILKKDGLILEDIMEMENDMGLGNGGLGRLAACFLDSMATLKLPTTGYGIRYEFGIFRQQIVDGYQVEQPDHWLSYGNPWETQRQELTFRVRFQGRVQVTQRASGKAVFEWMDTEDVLAVASDVPIPGYHSNTVNNLRLWQAKSTNEFSFQEFDRGNYLNAVENKNLSENISKVLYPNDSSSQGRVLRLKQEYFFVSASLQDIIRQYRRHHDRFDQFADKNFIQLNDTHPVIAIPELMRILMDENELEWDEAWAITNRTFGYTNHTVVSEALEEWPTDILKHLLPRHLQIIYEINRRFLDEVQQRYSKDPTVLAELSCIREHPEKRVRMANLAIFGCCRVNGVAALHTEILKSRVFPHFHALFPGKFINITNGITQRRWLQAANPLLATCITDTIGKEWLLRLDHLKQLEAHAEDATFQETWANIKWSNKLLLAQFLQQTQSIEINPDSLFDVQVKRLHMYKRQLLNVLHVITLYNRIKLNPELNTTPRTVFFGGKAAPAYAAAKKVIKLIHAVANVINQDPEIGDRLKVVFLENYSVSLAEKIIPAADLSEQISTAGLEASGTGNMKFALNGALTIGTMDGANVEMREEIGEENMFIFGLRADEVVALKQHGYLPYSYYQANNELGAVLDMIHQGAFSPDQPSLFHDLTNELFHHDHYCLLADYASYVAMQDQVGQAFLNPSEWCRKSILNVARIGKFSTDRSITDYNDQIWKAKPVEIKV